VLLEELEQLEQLEQQDKEERKENVGSPVEREKLVALDALERQEQLDILV